MSVAAASSGSGTTPSGLLGGGGSGAALSSSSSPSPPASPSSSDVNGIRLRKRELRTLVRSRLKAMSQEDVEAESERVWANLFRRPEYESAGSVALFLSMPRGEIVTDTALARVLEDGKTLYVPRVGLDFEKCDMDMIKVEEVSPPDAISMARSHERARELFYRDWPRNKWGIPEPPPDFDHEVARPGDIDLMVVPGLAFDRCGGRLGQGKGYYDRFIAIMRGGPPRRIGEKEEEKGDGSVEREKAKPILAAVALGASFIEGEGPQVPMSSYDYPMDLLVLPTESISITKDGSIRLPPTTDESGRTGTA